MAREEGVCLLALIVLLVVSSAPAETPSPHVASRNAESSCTDAAADQEWRLEDAAAGIDGNTVYDFDSVELEWRQEAVAHIASLAARHAHCQRHRIESEACHQRARDFKKIQPLREEARLAGMPFFGSAEKYEEASMQLQQAQFSEALASLENSIALKFYPYPGDAMLTKWQKGFSSPGPAFQKLRLELADALTLMSDSQLEMAQERGDVVFLAQGRAALDVAWALREVEGDLDAVDASMRYMRTLRGEIAAAAADMLPSLSLQELQRLLEERDVELRGDGLTHGELLASAASALHLPPVPPHDTRKDQEWELPLCEGMDAWEEVLRRLLGRAAGMVSSSRYRKLGVKCGTPAGKSAKGKGKSKGKSKGKGGNGGGECLSYVPAAFLPRCQLPAGSAGSAPPPPFAAAARGVGARGSQPESGLVSMVSSWFGIGADGGAADAKAAAAADDDVADWGGAFGNDPGLVAALRGFAQDHELETRLFSELSSMPPSADDYVAPGIYRNPRFLDQDSDVAASARSLGKGIGMGDSIWSDPRLSEAFAMEMAIAAAAAGAADDAAPVDEYREERDRQLQEELLRLARENIAAERDSPLVPTILCGCVLAGGIVFLTRGRRRRAAGAGATGKSGSRAGAGRGAGAEATALRAAVAAGDAAKLQKAIDEYEEAAGDVDPALLRRARAALAERKKSEKNASKAKAKAAKARLAERNKSGEAKKPTPSERSGADLASIALIKARRAEPERRGGGAGGASSRGEDSDEGEWAPVSAAGKAHAGHGKGESHPSSLPSPTSVVTSAAAAPPSPPSSESSKARSTASGSPRSSIAGEAPPSALPPLRAAPGPSPSRPPAHGSARTGRAPGPAPSFGGSRVVGPGQKDAGGNGAARTFPQHQYQHQQQQHQHQHANFVPAHMPFGMPPPGMYGGGHLYHQQQHQHQQHQQHLTYRGGGVMTTESMALAGAGANWSQAQQLPLPPGGGLPWGAGAHSGHLISAHRSPSGRLHPSPGLSPIGSPMVVGSPAPSSVNSGATTPQGSQHSQDTFPINLRSIWGAPSSPLDLGPPAVTLGVPLPPAPGGLWAPAPQAARPAASADDMDAEWLAHLGRGAEDLGVRA